MKHKWYRGNGVALISDVLVSMFWGRRPSIIEDTGQCYDKVAEELENKQHSQGLNRCSECKGYFRKWEQKLT